MNHFPSSNRNTIKQNNINKITSNPIVTVKSTTNSIYPDNKSTLKNSNYISSLIKTNKEKGSNNSNTNTNKLTKSLHGHFDKLFLNYYSQNNFSFTPKEINNNKTTKREDVKSKEKEYINPNKSKIEYGESSTLTSEQNYKEVIKAKDKEINKLRNELLKTQKLVNDINKQIVVASIKQNKKSYDSRFDCNRDRNQQTNLNKNQNTKDSSYEEYNSFVTLRGNQINNNNTGPGNVVNNQRSSRSLKVQMKKSFNNVSSSKNANQNIKKTEKIGYESLVILKKRAEVILNKYFTPYLTDNKQHTIHYHNNKKKIN